MPRGAKARDVLTRIVERCAYEGACLVYQRRPSKDGYAQVRYGMARPHVHRVVWEECFGPIPEGNEIHHVCGNPRCVLPDHLESLTAAEHRVRHGKLAEREHGTPTMYTHGKCRCSVCREAWAAGARKGRLRKRSQEVLF